MVNSTYRWKFADETATATGSSRLVFTKNEERCTIDVERIPGSKNKQDKPVVFIHIRLNYRYH